MGHVNAAPQTIHVAIVVSIPNLRVTNQHAGKVVSRNTGYPYVVRLDE